MADAFKPCSVSGCNVDIAHSKNARRGMCTKHYKEWKRARPIRCSIDGCDQPVVGRGWCTTHYHRWRRNGDAEQVQKERGGGHNRIDITGQRFGKLLAIRPSHSDGQKIIWLCQCDCGQQSLTSAAKLNIGHSTSCGKCRGTHRATKSPAYQSWQAMKHRCMNPKSIMFHRYGGRGVEVCSRWAESFEAFLGDMGERPRGHTLDRINNDGNYEPGNCRWAPKLVQDNNRSTSVMFTVRGMTDTLPQLVRNLSPKPAVGINTVYSRLSRGWQVDDAFYVPSRSPKAFEISQSLRRRP